MANGNNEFVEVMSESALKEIQLSNKELTQMVTNIETINKLFKETKLPSESKKAIETATKEVDKSVAARERSVKAMERERLAELNLQKAREKAVDTFVKNEAKEQAALERSETAYQRIQNSVNLLTKTYQDLAIRKQLGSTLTAKEEAQLLSLTNRLNTYQSALKKVDADMQKNQRNVGNYASGWNGLGNSINQITRELPAFTFSAQTGILALSNNIPILTDEIGRLRLANEQLIAQGKPVKSVLSQILSAFLSWQTAMGVGILLLTLYGKEIGEFAKNMFSFEKSLTSAEVAQRSINESKKEGIRASQDELVQLKLNLKAAQDTKKSDEQRLLAVKAIKEQYPDYLENISDEAILSGRASEAVKELTTAIVNNAKAQAAKGRILENETKILDLLDREREIRSDISKQEKINEQLRPRALEESKSLSDRNTLLTRYNDGTSRSISLRSRLSDVEKEINNITKSNNILVDYAVNNTTLFSKATEKTKEATDKVNESYLYSLYLIERQIELQQRISDDEKNTLDERAVAVGKSANLQIEKARLVLNEEIRTNKDRQLALAKYYDTVADITRARGIELKKLNNELLADESKLTSFIYTQELSRLKAIFSDEKNAFTDRVQALTNAEELAVKEAQRIRDLGLNDAKNNYAAREVVEREYYATLKKIREDFNKDLESATGFDLDENSVFGNMEQASQGFADLMENLAQQTGVPYEDLIDKFESIHAKNLDNAKQFYDAELALAEDSAEKRKKIEEDIAEFNKDKRKEVFYASIDLANTLFDAQVSKYDEQIERSNEYYDALLSNAENGSEQEMVLMQQKKEAEDRIREQQREAQRRQAIFNKILAISEIAINTAVGVSAALKVQNYAGVALTLALGALQTATVIATPLPQYKYGTDNHPGGDAIVGDGGVSEVMILPDGQVALTPNVPTVVHDMPKGTQVIPSEREFYKSMAFNSFSLNFAKLEKLDSIISKGIKDGFRNAKIKNSVYLPKQDLSHLNYIKRGIRG